MHSPRLNHLWKITRWGWFVTYEVGWIAIYLNADVIVGKYGSEKAKYIWERITHPHWGWKSFVIGALIIAIFFLWEGSFRNEREATAAREALQKKIQALEEVTPDLMLTVGVEGDINKIFVENTGPGTARQVNLHCHNEDSKLLFDTIPYIPNGQKVPFKSDYLVDNNFGDAHIFRDIKKYMREKPEEPGIQSVMVEQLLVLLHRNQHLKLFRQNFYMFLNKNSDELEIHPNGPRYHVPNQ